MTRRTKGIIKIPNELITIRIDKYGIMIDGHRIELFDPDNLNALKASGDEGNYKYVTEDDRPLNTYQYFIDNYLSQDQILRDLEIGSLEGKSRSWAYYEYVLVHLKLE